MDRRFAYIGAIPQDLDALKPQRNTMIALGYLAQGVLGTDTLVDGLACTPSVPPDLSVHIGAGEIFTLQSVDATAYGSLAADNVHQIIRQGVLLDQVTLTVTPPGTPGQAINYLVQVQLLEQDIDIAVLPYFNPASLTNPGAVAWSGPSNSGVSQPLTRQQTITVSLKPGVAATAGSQVTPAPDAGYTGLWAITVAQGATQITGANIAEVPAAPFIWLKLPEVPGWVQGGAYAWAVDTSASANSIIVTLDPIPAVIGTGGFGIRCKVANAVTGATTLTIKRPSFSDLGPYAVVRASGSPLLTGDISADQVVDLVFDGTSFRDITGTTTSIAVGSLTAQSGEGVEVDGTAHVNLNFPGLSPQTPVGPDLFSFYSQGDTHHRVLTYAQLLALIGAGAGSFKGIQIITTTGVWSKPSDVNFALVFAQGPGGAGGGASAELDAPAGPGGTRATVLTEFGCPGGSGEMSLAWVNLTAVPSVPCTIGDGGTGVIAHTGNAGSGPTSFGPYAIGNPGQGGDGPDVTTGTYKNGGPGGFGGVPTGAVVSIQFKGQQGGLSPVSPGGNSVFSGGGRGARVITTANAGDPGEYGSGGGGSYGGSSTGAPIAGAPGGKGFILLLLFS